MIISDTSVNCDIYYTGDFSVTSGTSVTVSDNSDKPREVIMLSRVTMNLARRKDCSLALARRKASSLVSLREGQVVVDRARGDLVLDSVWLRDHCRAQGKYSWETHQREGGLALASLQVGALAARLEGDRLEVAWADSTQSSFSLAWLEQHYRRAQPQVPAQLWGREEQEELLSTTKVDWQFYMEEEEGVAQLLTNILRFGLGQVVGCPVSREGGTRAVVERLARVMGDSPYEQVWQFGSVKPEDEESSDSAYSSQALASHTDGTYMTEAPGLQAFHVLSSTALGGSTILSDGWAVAAALARDKPSLYRILAEQPIPSEYIHHGEGRKTHFHCTDTVLKHCPLSGGLVQFRYNTYDRAPMDSVPHDSLRDVYSALAALEEELEKAKHQVQTLLQPGTVLLLDNWRVTHARTAFTGHRAMSGCYVTRSHWRSRARGAGLL